MPLIGTIPAVFTEADGLAYLERQHQRLTRRHGLVLRDRRAAGRSGRRRRGSVADTRVTGATAGYTVAPADRGRGYAKAGLRALTAFAWTQPDLDRVELFIEPANLASIAVARSCGYHEEGLLIRHTEIGGRLRDMLRYAAERAGRPEVPRKSHPIGGDWPSEGLPTPIG